MTHATEARRWKLVALAALATMIGYVAGQLSPSATARQGVTKAQLDTSNCRIGSTRWSLATIPDGAIVTAVVEGVKAARTVTHPWAG